MDGDEPVDVATQREVRTAIRSEVSGLSEVWLCIYFLSKWQTGKSKVHRKSVFIFF